MNQTVMSDQEDDDRGVIISDDSSDNNSVKPSSYRTLLLCEPGV